MFDRELGHNKPKVPVTYMEQTHKQFDISMYDLSDLPNKITYCNWRIGMVFNGTKNEQLYHHNIVNFISTRLVGNH